MKIAIILLATTATFLAGCATPAGRHHARVDRRYDRVDDRHYNRYDRRSDRYERVETRYGY